MMNKLADLLLGRQISLEEGCEELSINPDLTLSEEFELHNLVFQCGICGAWHESCEAHLTYEYGFICEECYSEQE